MTTLIIPMAGRGARFAGYSLRKPLLPVPAAGNPGYRDECMFAAAVRRFPTRWPVVLIAPKWDTADEAFTFKNTVADLRNAGYQINTVVLEETTAGAACSVAAAAAYAPLQDRAVIVNCDNLFGEIPIEFFTNDDSGIVVFDEPTKDGKWSYVEFRDESPAISLVVEKQAISSWATAGIYAVQEFGMLLSALHESQIMEEERPGSVKVNNEFYLAPLFNALIAEGFPVRGYVIAASAMIGVGTPEMYQDYLFDCLSPLTSGIRHTVFNRAGVL